MTSLAALLRRFGHKLLGPCVHLDVLVDLIELPELLFFLEVLHSRDQRDHQHGRNDGGSLQHPYPSTVELCTHEI